MPGTLVREHCCDEAVYPDEPDSIEAVRRDYATTSITIQIQVQPIIYFTLPTESSFTTDMFDAGIMFEVEASGPAIVGMISLDVATTPPLYVSSDRVELMTEPGIPFFEWTPGSPAKGFFRWNTDPEQDTGKYRLTFTGTGDTEASGTKRVTITVEDPSDSDGDGISNGVDLSPTVYSDEFSDRGQGGSTTGEILDRGDQELSVRDFPEMMPTDLFNPGAWAGVEVYADSSGSGRPAIVTFCGGAHLFDLHPGEMVRIFCESATIQVYRGAVEVTFVATDDRNATASLPAGHMVTFYPDTFTAAADPYNLTAVTLTVDGAADVIAPGERLLLDTDPEPVVQDAGDGQGGTQGQGTGTDETRECVIRVLGREPSGPQDVTDEERRLIAQECLGGGGGRGPGGPSADVGAPDGPGAGDAEVQECVIRVLGREPSGPQDMSDEERQLVAQECGPPPGGDGAPGGGPSGTQDQGTGDQARQECVIRVLGREPSGPQDMTDEERQLVAQECGPPPDRAGQ